MKVRNGALTPRERLFVEHYAGVGHAVYAAEKAGYADPDSDGSRLPERPRISAALERARERLRDVGGPIGVETLIELTGKRYPPGTRRAAASDLIKYAGLAAIDEALNKPIYEMTAAEIDQRRQHLMKELSDMALPVILEAESVPDDGVFG